MSSELSKTVKIGNVDYIVSMTVAGHRRVKDMTGISLPDCVQDVSGAKTPEERAAGMALYNKVMDDFDLLPRIVYALLLPELQKNNVSEDAFFGMVDGPMHSAFGDAVTQALIDFFQNDRLGRGKLLATSVKMAKKAMAMQDQWSEKAAKAMNRKMEKMQEGLNGPKADALVEEMIQKTLTNSSTTSQESLVSILDLSR